MTSHNNDDNHREHSALPAGIDEIKQLVELMVANDLSRVELRQGDAHILLRRGQPVIAGTVAAPMAPLPAPVAAPAPSATPAHVDAGSPATNEVLIRSPMVGTFYTAADPESPPFASVGTEIRADTVVCLIEAMKVFNEIKADVAGRISKVLVKNAQAVEYDQPLFAVVPA